MFICKKLRKKLSICILSMFCLFVFGCSSVNNISSEPPIEQNNSSDVNASLESSIEIADQSENTEDPYIKIDEFIDLYSSSLAQITDISEMDIHGDDYRTEFRLNAFKNAVGKKCTVDSSYIEIVNYGTWSNAKMLVGKDKFCFNDEINNPINKDTELFTSIIHILDNTISDDEINEICDSLNDNDQNFLLGKGNYITGYIISNYKDGVIGGYDMMIDCSKINYLE